MTKEIILNAPFAGWLTPLEEVPDAVFAERMMGEGVAIDPLERVLRAPADGTILSIPRTAHAVTMRLENGAEILIHVGLETVALEGAGFHALARSGARVKAGEPLIELDLESIARSAKSLVTPIVVASEGYEFHPEATSRTISAGGRIGTISSIAPETREESEGESFERSVSIDIQHGLHARPAARIAALLRQLKAEVELVLGERRANARSTVAMLGLGARNGDEILIRAKGEDASAALDAVARLIASGLKEPDSPHQRVEIARREGPISASPGLVIGKAVQLRIGDLPVPRDGEGVEHELGQLAAALKATAASLVEGDSVGAELEAAHRELLADPELIDEATIEIREGRGAGFAWRSACERAREKIKATGDALLAERAADLKDLEQRVIAMIVGDVAPVPDIPAGSILIAPDLLPSQFLSIDKSRVQGICTAEGGSTSHVAILAASAGIPMLVGAGPAILKIADGATMILDADRERIESDPSRERLKEVETLVSDRSARREAELRDAGELCFTSDGTRIEVFANLGSLEDAHAAVEAGAEGCGLLRTEFLFLDRQTPPSREEQERVYQGISGALAKRPLIVRTLDIGADKDVPYVAIAREDNPALGLRGIRLSLARPDLLLNQLLAIVASVPADQCRIMLPMITEVEEIKDVRKMLEATLKEAGRSDTIPLGVMIETPAAALLADKIAAEADFLSVGTNDLTQYALAADRMNSAVSSRADALHPAVLRLIREAAAGARAHNRWIGVCGGLASDPLAAPILIGLGITELSAVPSQVPAIKAVVRGLKMDECRVLAERACAASSAHEVRFIAAGALQ